MFLLNFVEIVQSTIPLGNHCEYSLVDLWSWFLWFLYNKTSFSITPSYQ